MSAAVKTNDLTCETQYFTNTFTICYNNPNHRTERMRNRRAKRETTRMPCDPNTVDSSSTRAAEHSVYSLFCHFITIEKLALSIKVGVMIIRIVNKFFW